MEQPVYSVFVGIDWATESHQVCVIDPQRKVLSECSIEHSGDGLADLCQRLLGFGAKAESVAVGIEVPRGAVVEGLVEKGFHVYSINPKQLDRFRDRHTVAGAKDDRRDAFVLADSLRTDLECFHRVSLDDPLIIELRELTRIEEDLKKDLGRLANQLRDVLGRYFPEPLKLCPAADEAWLWDVLELVPEPPRGQPPAARIRAVLKKARIRRFTSVELLTLIRAPALPVAPGVVEACTQRVAFLVPRLRLVDSQLNACKKRVANLLDRIDAAQKAKDEAAGQKREHSDVEILRSLPGVGDVVAATMLAEASQALSARDYQALRFQAGVAPVTAQTGKQTSRRTQDDKRRHRKPRVSMRRACNPRLRRAVHFFADRARTDERTKALYAAARARGHSHGRALRGIADRLLNVLVAMLERGTMYDSTKRRQLLEGTAATS
jgi:transposase